MVGVDLLVGTKVVLLLFVVVELIATFLLFPLNGFLVWFGGCLFVVVCGGGGGFVVVSLVVVVMGSGRWLVMLSGCPGCLLTFLETTVNCCLIGWIKSILEFKTISLSLAW